MPFKLLAGGVMLC